MTALRIARYRNLPLVFTNHTMYEQYTHDVPVESTRFRRFVIEFLTRYANLCDQVFAPSESITMILLERGIDSPIDVLPTGVNLEEFSQGDGYGFRASKGIPQNAFLVGHVGRLAPEKNLGFLVEAVAEFLRNTPRAHFLLVGKGPLESEMRQTMNHRDG